MNANWSLKELYESIESEKFQSDMAKLDVLIAKINALPEQLTSSERDNLLNILSLREEMNTLAEGMFLYCMLRCSTDTNDVKAAGTVGVLSQKFSSTTKANTMLDKYIGSVDLLEEVIESDPKLKEYKFYLTQIKNDAAHRLADEVEEALAIMDISGGSAWGKLQSNQTSKLKVSYNGETITLSDVRNLAHDADPGVRKAAYEAELAAYPQVEDAVAYALNSIKLQANNVARMRGFDSVLDKTLYDSTMKKETLDALLGAMDEYLPKFHAYLRAKGKALGHENGCPWYDMFAPMGKLSSHYTLEEARDYLLGLFGGFNPELKAIAEKAFNQDWIDYYPKAGKEGGAFCAGANSIKEFRILTNFNGSFSSVVTLAHELGHGYHDFMIHNNLPLNMGYAMPVAETASTFNENVVNAAALANCTDKDEKLAILEYRLSDTTQIICDIYSRFLFEKEVCERRNTEFLSAEQLCEIMLRAQKKAYGDGLDPEYLHPYMWLCKGHYYSAGLGFYNFPYAFGGLFARGLYEKYLVEKDSFLPKFNKMLQSTPTNTVEDAAKICGVDLTTKDFWRIPLEAISKEIDEFIELVK